MPVHRKDDVFCRTKNLRRKMMPSPKKSLAMFLEEASRMLCLWSLGLAGFVRNVDSPQSLRLKECISARTADGVRIKAKDFMLASCDIEGSNSPLAINTGGNNSVCQDCSQSFTM